jgi:sRNA-binding carbon storage regulator CsrA
VLVITRRENEVITIEPVCGLDPRLTLQHVFEQGPIEIRLIRITGHKVRIAVAAPNQMKIWRGWHESEAAAPPQLAGPDA